MNNFLIQVLQSICLGMLCFAFLTTCSAQQARYSTVMPALQGVSP
ncbi:hypothetical protein [Alkanindiges illinoisensis]|nr:hypothetical protein [Alkanindiges illinoisensis]